MTDTYLYAGIGVVAGFLAGVLLPLYQIFIMRRKQKSLEGFLESEKLIRERLQKENKHLLSFRETSQQDYENKIEELKGVIRQMDSDIILLQKSNEETEALLHATDPIVHNLKIKLIEANNTIARYKGQILKEAAQPVK